MQQMEQTMNTRPYAAKSRRTAHTLREYRDPSAYRLNMTMGPSLFDGFGDATLIDAGQTLM